MSPHPVPKPIELVYRVVDGVSIAMDVYIPENATKATPAPVLLWWHGEECQRLSFQELTLLCRRWGAVTGTGYPTLMNGNR